MVFIIDGNYFAQRVRNGCDLSFMVNPEDDKAALIEACATTLASEIRQMDGIIDSVIITRDNSSWRKQVTPLQPTEPMLRIKGKGYKENRDEIVKDYDSEAFYAAYDQFCDLCESKLNIPTIKTIGAEADDSMYICARLIEKAGGEVLLWSSDGDYLHCITEKIHYLKYPKRDLCMIKGSSIVKKKSMMDVFGSKAPSKTNLLMESLGGRDKVREIIPSHSLIEKIVYGDEKDNVPPIFTFWSKNHKTQYRPTIKKIQEAYEACGHEWDAMKKSFLYDEVEVKRFLVELVRICKVENQDIKHLYKVFVSSRNLKHLSVREIPKEVVRRIFDIFKAKQSMRQDLKLLSNYQQVIQAFGKLEKGNYFTGLNLNIE